MSIGGSSKLRLLRIEELNSDLALFSLPKGFHLVSNAVNWSPSKRFERIAIARVPKDFSASSVNDVLNYVKRVHGLDSESLVMLTSANLREALYATSLGEPKAIDIVVSVGFEPPACIDIDDVFRPLGASTINLVVAVDEGFTPSGLEDLFKLVVEAKSATIASISLKCRSTTFGTITDAIAVASRAGSALCAGIATDVGNAIAKAIRRMLVEAYRRSRDTFGALEDVMGISVEELLDEALRAYREAPVPNVSEERVKEMLLEELEEALSDPNVWSLILAARALDDRGAMHTLWRLPSGEYEADSPRIVADELVGMALANYLHGSRAVFAMVWIEKLKKRGALPKLQRLPMFLDDVASALIASILSRVYTKLLREVGREL